MGGVSPAASHFQEGAVGARARRGPRANNALLKSPVAPATRAGQRRRGRQGVTGGGWRRSASPPNQPARQPTKPATPRATRHKPAQRAAPRPAAPHTPPHHPPVHPTPCRCTRAASAALPADGVDLVDEDDGRGTRPRLADTGAGARLVRPQLLAWQHLMRQPQADGGRKQPMGYPQPKEWP